MNFRSDLQACVIKVEILQISLADFGIADLSERLDGFFGLFRLQASNILAIDKFGTNNYGLQINPVTMILNRPCKVI